ncbi:hypothetical protein WN51_04394 [Melipona quadrifasciata]|uniref:Uncharacterized protein n=1 Tax=Melipona quadrifasciata TaxID=166423 RepID=A0A0M8ZUA0_9HYME|nr:hypothetical protein WN51_04394 [Melipona quadrifasciata]
MPPFSQEPIFAKIEVTSACVIIEERRTSTATMEMHADTNAESVAGSRSSHKVAGLTFKSVAGRGAADTRKGLPTQRLNEASGPSKQASNLAGRLACKQVSKRARQSGKPGKQTGKLAASETQREKRKRGHMTSRMRRGWVREEGGREGIDRTTRTVREYIPQHGSIRRRRRYMEMDQTGGERRGGREHSGGNVRLAGSWEREVNGGQRELMGRQGRGLVEASVRLGGGRRATRSGRQAGERRKNRERKGKREKEREIEEETLMSSSEVSETDRGGEWTGGWSTAWTAAIAGEMPNGLQDCAGLAVRSLARSGMADGR